MHTVIEHPYHYAGGTVTYEHVLPVRISSLPAFVGKDPFEQLTSLEELHSDQLHTWWRERSAAIRHPLSRGLADVVDMLFPVSIVIFESESWIRSQQNPIRAVNAAAGKWLLVPFLKKLPSISNFPLDRFAEAKEFLDFFRTLWGYIPPFISPWEPSWNKWLLPSRPEC